MIKFARSRIHGWGLYALQTIVPDEMIIEYVGEKIRPSVSGYISSFNLWKHV